MPFNDFVVTNQIASILCLSNAAAFSNKVTLAYVYIVLYTNVCMYSNAVYLSVCMYYDTYLTLKFIE